MDTRLTEPQTNTIVFGYRCVFVDAGVALIDIETKKRKEEIKLEEARARSVAEHGELALISVEGPQKTTQERMALRPPMLQVKEFLFYSCMKKEQSFDLPLADGSITRF